MYKLLPSEALREISFISSYGNSKGITQENLEAALTEGKVFIRGVFLPTGFAKKQKIMLSKQTADSLFKTLCDSFHSQLCPILLADSEVFNATKDIKNVLDQERLLKAYEKLGPDIIFNKILEKSGPELFEWIGSELFETLAGMELRKVSREKNVPTRTRKFDRTGKSGNPMRSTSMIGYGASVYSSVGFIIFDPAIRSIRGIDAQDNDSGRGKRSKLITGNLAKAMNLEKATLEQKAKSIGRS
ncbi:hypothetical protein [Legionella israelensis]|uniref:hypothetical protein n=1 Tax=Legionella israelensis TaxID=454 RepID=UPI001040FFB5|nr:hypothetical protein [Legionella israelensis]QBS09745.1 hypothetical protein E4T55_07665 [Legionella israelensis]